MSNTKETSPIDDIRFNPGMELIVEAGYDNGRYRAIVIYAVPGDAEKDEPPLKLIMSHNLGSDQKLFKAVMGMAAMQVMTEPDLDAVAEHRNVNSKEATRS